MPPFFSVLLVLASLVLSVTGPASAAPPDRELPYGAWRAPVPPKPEQILLERGPGPVAEAAEQARRLWEFVPDFGVALPGCAGRSSDCGGIRPGLEAGLSALYRPIPYFALGVTGRLDVFSLARTDAPGARAAEASFFGIVARIYAFESGLFDPYLELALGAGSLETSRGYANRREATHVDFTPAARVAAGLDFALNSWLRLGPALAMSQYASRDAAYCTEAGCVSRSGRETALPRSATSFGFRLTVAVGERL